MNFLTETEEFYRVDTSKMSYDEKMVYVHEIPHITDLSCWCQPSIDLRSGEALVIIHYLPH